MARYEVAFKPDESAIEDIRFNPSGMVGRDLKRRVRTLEFRARTSAGFRTGALKASIGSNPPEPTVTGDRGGGLQMKTGSPLRYAAAHHEGAKAHIIRPRRARALRFMVAGRIVFASRVRHPGNKPNPYLARWLREAVK